MATGRRPQPIEKRAAKGNPTRRPMPPAPPARVTGEIDAPVELQGIALDCWHRLSQVLAARGQLSLDSYWSLIALCECFAEWEELRRDLRANGRTQKVKIKGAAKSRSKASVMERQRPQVAMFQDADRRLKGWLIEFGLTDASRGKVGGGEPPAGKPNDPLAAYGLN